MRFSLEPEQRPEMRMRTLSIEEVLSLGGKISGDRPKLEHYFSPTKKEAFTKEYLHYLNSGLLEAKHGNMDVDQYLAFVLSFQFVAPLLDIQAQKEFGNFYRILKDTYQVEEIDLNIHFNVEKRESGMVSEQEAINTFRDELEDHYTGKRDVRESVQKRLKNDAITAIMNWQREKTIVALAEAFGRSIVIPSFFSFVDKKMIGFYRGTTHGITYRAAVPEELL